MVKKTPLAHHLRTGLDRRTGAEHGAAGRNHTGVQTAGEHRLPIGSGEVESTHRHLLQQRLKIPGAWWKKETAADMAQLRVMRANKEWQTFWQEKAA